MKRGYNSLINIGYGLILIALIWLAIREVKLLPAAFSESAAMGWRSLAAALLPILLILVYRLMSDKNYLDVVFGHRVVSLLVSLAMGMGFMAFLNVSQMLHPWHELLLGVMLGILSDLLFFGQQDDRRSVALSGLALYIGGLLHVLLFGITWL